MLQLLMLTQLSQLLQLLPHLLRHVLGYDTHTAEQMALWFLEQYSGVQRGRQNADCGWSFWLKPPEKPGGAEEKHQRKIQPTI